jgi:signal transduction histidine kinase
VAEEATRLLARFGRRYAAAVRLATLVPICAIALFRAPGDRLAATVCVAGVAAAWTCVYAWWLRADRRAVPVALGVLGVLDVLVLLALSASVLWTGAIDDTNAGWLRLLATFACVTCQWHTAPLAGGVAALIIGGGSALVVVAAGADADVITGQLWIPVAAALSRAAWLLVRRAALRADHMAAEAERARSASLVSSAVRAEERELANALHDTAATTLLMVGIGQVRADAGWLAPQARRDLARLRSEGDPADGEKTPRTDGEKTQRHADLVGLLRAEIDAARLTVSFDAPARLTLPADVARPIADAAREALTNVRRHAGTTGAAVRLCEDGPTVRLDIADQGSGFSTANVPATRRGLRESVRGRMSRIGGTATIISAEGEGTLVRLEWRTEP